MAEFIGIKLDKNIQNSTNKRPNSSVLPSFALYLKDQYNKVFKIPINKTTTRLPYASNYPQTWIFTNIQITQYTDLKATLLQQPEDFYKFTIVPQTAPGSPATHTL